MRNAGWMKYIQPGIKIVGRNINNLRYADDTTLMAKSEEELKSLLMKVKQESEKAGLKLNIHSLQVVNQFSQHRLLKRLSLLHCIFLPPLLKIRCP